MMDQARSNVIDPHLKRRSKRPHIVVVGAGFGGLAAAKKLANIEADVTVVDRLNHHTFQPLLYQVATAGLAVDDVCYATRGIFKKAKNIRVRHGAVSEIDLENKRLFIGDENDVLEYDKLILACGAVTSDFGIEGVADFGFGLKTAAEAINLRNHILTNFERVARYNSLNADQSPELTTVVVAGGGPTGVELAGGVIELFDRVLSKDFPDIDMSKARVVLVEAGPRLLSAMNEKLSDKARKRLEKMGVEIMVNSAVELVDENSVKLQDGTVLHSNTLVWAAGVKANPLGQALGVETVAGGRIVVDSDLSLPGNPDVFVIGDVAATKWLDDKLVPQMATGAIQMGEYVGDTLRRSVAPDTSEQTDIGPFEYKDKGAMATVGRNTGLVELPNGLRVSGWAGWVAWLGLHVLMLMGFRNRANVMVNWAWNYLTYDRGSRIIVE